MMEEQESQIQTSFPVLKKPSLYIDDEHTANMNKCTQYQTGK